MLGESAGNFLLSPRDLNAVELVPQLLDAGIDSLKIEGRMKRPEYVATIVHTYRKAIDHHLNTQTDAVDDTDRDHLAQVFNRDFTTAYMEKRQGRYMMSDRRPNNRGLLIGRVTAYDHAAQMVSPYTIRWISGSRSAGVSVLRSSTYMINEERNVRRPLRGRLFHFPFGEKCTFMTVYSRSMMQNS